MSRPYQSVQRRISRVAAPPNVADADTKRRVSPNILPSAVPNPPGRPEAEPISDETASINMVLIRRSGLPGTPSPLNTKYSATHSPDQEIRPIRIASKSG